MQLVMLLRQNFSSIAIAGWMTLGLLSCGSQTIGGSTSCAAGQAQILVQDGFFRNLCGCQESQGQFIQSGQPLNCTVAQGTTVLFLFNGTQNPHQIVTNTGMALTWTVNTGGGNPSTTPATYVFSTPGSFPFQDTYNPTMNGTFTVL